MEKIDLKENLIAATVVDVYKEILKVVESAAQSSSEIVIDCSNLKKVDGSGIQLLIVLLKEQKEGKIPLVVDHLSDSIRQNIVLTASKYSLEEVL